MSYNYTKADCDCKYCRYRNQNRCTLPVCCCIDDKIRTGSPMLKYKAPMNKHERRKMNKHERKHRPIMTVTAFVTSFKPIRNILKKFVCKK